MNPWTRIKVDEPRSKVEGGEPVLCDYAPKQATIQTHLNARLRRLSKYCTSFILVVSPARNPCSVNQLAIVGVQSIQINWYLVRSPPSGVPDANNSESMHILRVKCAGRRIAANFATTSEIAARRRRNWKKKWTNGRNRAKFPSSKAESCSCTTF
jgi:hypothetical protein